MALIQMREVSWGLGGAPLLEKVSLEIEKGQRVCLLGRNGVGKSSLMKLLSGKIPPDQGEIRRQQGCTIACLEQDVPAGTTGTIFQVVAEGLGDRGRALAEYQRVCRLAESARNRELIQKRDELQAFLDGENGWALLKQIENTLSRSRLEPEQPFSDLSAGMKRRTLLARAFVLEADLLLLDEPTNHLDIDAILWLEDFLLRHVKTLLFVTHDRAFMKKIASRILELDRGRLFAHNCDYDTFLSRRQAELEAQERQDSLFDKKLSAEEAWIRQGVKARRTRNEGRVRALMAMREQYKARRRKVGEVRMQVQEAEKSGKLVMEADNINFFHGERCIIRNFSTVIMRGDKVGIIGPNGAGKTTLLQILLQQIAPDSGRVRHGTRLQPVYSDQLRSRLMEDKTVQENIAEGNDFIEFNGKRRHVIGYLQDFLFAPDRCRTPVHVLSGGEKNRLMLAKLFAKPSNLLVLDEPTNDLDVETLELLEEMLFEYQGTLLLVSHDRSFLNNVVTATLVFEGDGRVEPYVGGYDDWLSQRAKAVEPAATPGKALKDGKTKVKSPSPRKLGYMEKRELADLPRKIEELEATQKAVYAALSAPDFYKKDKTELIALQKQHEELTLAIEAAYLRWAELESINP